MNPLITAAAPSLIRQLHAKKRSTSIDLGLGEPTLPPPIASFERATEWIRENGCRYSTTIGDIDLREAIAMHYGYPELREAANVCITSGSQEAVYIALKALIDPALEDILVVEPAFPVYAKIATIEGIAVRTVSMPASSGFAYDPDAILEAIGPKTRLIVICSPSNPTGRVMSPAAAQNMARALLDRPGPPIYVLHDEIYRELAFAPAANFADYYPHTIAINSLSKSNSLTGLRIGWVIAPKNAMPEIVKMHGWTTSCASTFAQRVAYDVFANDTLAENREWYAKQSEGAMAAADAAGLPYVVPDGAFYLCVDVGSKDTVKFAYDLIEHEDVVAIPGSNFGNVLEGWLRTSFVAPLDLVREGYMRIARARS